MTWLETAASARSFRPRVKYRIPIHRVVITTIKVRRDIYRTGFKLDRLADYPVCELLISR